MKKALIISIIVFIVSAVAFGISVAVTGVTEGTFNVAVGNFMNRAESPNEQEFIFEEDFKDIRIENGSADVKVSVADVEETTVRFKSSSGLMRINSYVKNDRLVVECDDGFYIIGWFISGDEAELQVILPEKKYRNVEFVTGAGSADIKKLISENFEAQVASGSGYYNIFADEIEVDVASGSVEIENCTPNKAKSIKLEAASGNHKLKGFETEKFNFDVASGAINAYDISGKGDVSLASGDINIEYRTWDNNLSVDAISGDVDVKLPIGSGVEVDLDAASGSVLVQLDNGKDDGVDYSSFSGSTNTGRLGGDNVRQVDVDLVSGEVNIHN